MKFLIVIVGVMIGSCCLAEQARSVNIKNIQPISTSRIALVIGNSEYQTSPLKNPKNDAEDVASALSQLGFNVTVLLDADYAAMNQAATVFGQQIKGQGGVALFYFAGHGMQVEGSNFLIPIDANITGEEEVSYKSIDAGLILAKMESAGSKTNIMILDACRNNPYVRSFRSGVQGLAQMDAPTGTLIVYATAPGDVAFDGSARNGVFTENLLQNIGTPNIDIELMFRRVRVGVLHQTAGRQTPWTSSSLRDDFSFRGNSGELSPATPLPTIARQQTKQDWRTSLPKETEIADVIGSNSLIWRISSTGRSTSIDSVSRKIMAQKAAMRNVSLALRKRLAFYDISPSRTRLRRLETEGELSELEYLDDGKEVLLTYDIPIPADFGEKIRAAQTD
ncbi:MAG: hypothetical protein ACJAW7_000732 [Candidatus Azotimanducaceae bacterium]